MKVLVTGGCGFLGSNLVAEGIGRGHEMLALDNLSRFGASKNLDWLRTLGKFEFRHLDTRSFSDLEGVIRTFRPDAVFHLAGQVAMTTSLENPRQDFEINVVGGHNLIESVRRHVPEARVLYSSTNKVYGDLLDVPISEAKTRYLAEGYEQGFNESLRLEFQSPYGCSKGATDQYMLDYHRMYGLKTMVFRHSSVFGVRQFGTFDQGWVGWFLQQALETKRNPKHRFTIAGDGKQVRDVLFSDDLVDCYFSALEAGPRALGQAYNIGGGMENSLSLLELFEFLNQELGVSLQFERLPWRQSDQKVFVADIRKATKLFGWKPKTNKAAGLRSALSWAQKEI
ncbi:MAG: hypothetical protein RJB38_421 [Pseudomonadota bacterium]